MSQETNPSIWHETFIKYGESTEVVECMNDDCVCGNNPHFHCPYCNVLHFRGIQAEDVIKHLEIVHWPTAVQFKDVTIVCCNCGRLGKSHYHCPLCSEVEEERGTFLNHLQEHLKHKDEDLSLVYAPDTDKPQHVVCEGLDIKLCDKSCVPDSVGHYHCPGCLTICTSSSVISNHIRNCQGIAEVGNNTNICIQDPRKELPVWNKSIIRTPYDLPVGKCSKACCKRPTAAQHHCPLCIFKPIGFSVPNIRKHFKIHFDKCVTFKGYTYLTCNLLCDISWSQARTHYHCGYCGGFSYEKLAHILHLKACHRQKSPPIQEKSAEKSPGKDLHLRHAEPESISSFQNEFDSTLFGGKTDGNGISTVSQSETNQSTLTIAEVSDIRTDVTQTETNQSTVTITEILDQGQENRENDVQKPTIDSRSQHLLLQPENKTEKSALDSSPQPSLFQSKINGEKKKMVSILQPNLLLPENKAEKPTLDKCPQPRIVQSESNGEKTKMVSILQPNLLKPENKTEKPTLDLFTQPNVFPSESNRELILPSNLFQPETKANQSVLDSSQQPSLVQQVLTQRVSLNDLKTADAEQSNIKSPLVKKASNFTNTKPTKEVDTENLSSDDDAEMTSDIEPKVTGNDQSDVLKLNLPTIQDTASAKEWKSAILGALESTRKKNKRLHEALRKPATKNFWNEPSDSRIDASETHYPSKESLGIQAFSSISATLSPNFLGFMGFKSKKEAERLLKNVANATHVEFLSAPGTDPDNPVFCMQGDIDGLVSAQHMLHQEVKKRNKVESLIIRKSVLANPSRFFNRRSVSVSTNPKFFCHNFSQTEPCPGQRSVSVSTNPKFFCHNFSQTEPCPGQRSVSVSTNPKFFCHNFSQTEPCPGQRSGAVSTTPITYRNAWLQTDNEVKPQMKSKGTSTRGLNRNSPPTAQNISPLLQASPPSVPSRSNKKSATPKQPALVTIPAESYPTFVLPKEVVEKLLAHSGVLAQKVPSVQYRPENSASSSSQLTANSKLDKGNSGSTVPSNDSTEVKKQESNFPTQLSKNNKGKKLTSFMGAPSSSSAGDEPPIVVPQSEFSDQEESEPVELTPPAHVESNTSIQTSSPKKSCSAPKRIPPPSRMVTRLVSKKQEQDQFHKARFNQQTSLQTRGLCKSNVKGKGVKDVKTPEKLKRRLDSKKSPLNLDVSKCKKFKHSNDADNLPSKSLKVTSPEKVNRNRNSPRTRKPTERLIAANEADHKMLPSKSVKKMSPAKGVVENQESPRTRKQTEKLIAADEADHEMLPSKSVMKRSPAKDVVENQESPRTKQTEKLTASIEPSSEMLPSKSLKKMSPSKGAVQNQNSPRTRKQPDRLIATLEPSSEMLPTKSVKNMSPAKGVVENQESPRTRKQTERLTAGKETDQGNLGVLTPISSKPGKPVGRSLIKDTLPQSVENGENERSKESRVQSVDQEINQRTVETTVQSTYDGKNDRKQDKLDALKQYLQKKEELAVIKRKEREKMSTNSTGQIKEIILDKEKVSEKRKSNLTETDVNEVEIIKVVEVLKKTPLSEEDQNGLTTTYNDKNEHILKDAEECEKLKVESSKFEVIENKNNVGSSKKVTVNEVNVMNTLDNQTKASTIQTANNQKEVDPSEDTCDHLDDEVEVLDVVSENVMRASNSPEAGALQKSTLKLKNGNLEKLDEMTSLKSSVSTSPLPVISSDCEAGKKLLSNLLSNKSRTPSTEITSTLKSSVSASNQGQMPKLNTTDSTTRVPDVKGPDQSMVTHLTYLFPLPKTASSVPGSAPNPSTKPGVNPVNQPTLLHGLLKLHPTEQVLDPKMLPPVSPLLANSSSILQALSRPRISLLAPTDSLQNVNKGPHQLLSSALEHRSTSDKSKRKPVHSQSVKSATKRKIVELLSDKSKKTTSAVNETPLVPLAATSTGSTASAASTTVVFVPTKPLSGGTTTAYRLITSGAGNKLTAVGSSNIPSTSSSSLVKQLVTKSVRPAILKPPKPALELSDFLETKSIYLPPVRVGRSFEAEVVFHKGPQIERFLKASGMENILTRTRKPKGKTKTLPEDHLSNSDLKFEESHGPILCELEQFAKDKNQDLQTLLAANLEELYSSTCPICHDAIVGCYKFLTHLMVIHSKFRCTQCPGLFVRKSSLINHLRTVHKRPGESLEAVKERPSTNFTLPNCGECNETFLNRRYLDEHQTYAHGRPETFKCFICNSPLSYYYMSNHITFSHPVDHAVDPGGKPIKAPPPKERFICPTCGKTFRHKNSLHIHEESHKPEEERVYYYICSHCGDKFRNKTRFQNHMNTKHTREKTHHCKECDKWFRTSNILCKHRTIEHKKKRFRCEVCSREFKLNATLKKHMVTHTGVSKHRCSLCQRAFGCNTVLKAHFPRCQRRQLGLKPLPWGYKRKSRAKKKTTTPDVQSTDTSTVPLESVENENQEVLEYDVSEAVTEEYMYMCSACNCSFQNMNDAENHIRFCVV